MNNGIKFFRILCVGYGAYAVANVLTLILMYFTAYKDAKLCTTVFAISTTAFSVVTLYLPSKYYGFGFALGSIIFLILAVLRLVKYTKKLPYHILSKQPLLVEPKRGIGTKLYLRFFNQMEE